ncbi:MAG: hypothetical protein WDM76_09520 [Limisphaerales bacterium]
MLDYFIGSDDASSKIHISPPRSVKFCFNSSKSTTAATQTDLATSGANSPATQGGNSPLNYHGTQFSAAGNQNITLVTDQGAVQGAFDAIEQAITTVNDAASASVSSVSATVDKILANQADLTTAGQSGANKTVLYAVIAVVIGAVLSLFAVFRGKAKA